MRNRCSKRPFTQARDPQVWGSPDNAIALVGAIRNGLIELSPADQAKFTKNATQLINELQQLHSWINLQIQTIPPDQRQLC